MQGRLLPQESLMWRDTSDIHPVDVAFNQRADLHNKLGQDFTIHGHASGMPFFRSCHHVASAWPLLPSEHSHRASSPAVPHALGLHRTPGLHTRIASFVMTITNSLQPHKTSTVSITLKPPVVRSPAVHMDAFMLVLTTFPARRYNDDGDTCVVPDSFDGIAEDTRYKKGYSPRC